MIDPYNPSIGLTPPNLKADVVMVSHDHEGHNNLKAVSGEVRAITWPGEYEVKGMAITAHMVPYSKEGTPKKEGKGLFFVIDADNIKICFLGDIGNELSDELIESIGDVDILIVPVGGHNTTDAKQAHLLIEEIEPRAVIPMHYATEGIKADLDDIEPFMKELGSAAPESKDKFSIGNRHDLDEEKMEIIILNPQIG